MVKVITSVPENLDTTHTWECICEHSNYILENKDTITPSQASDLLVRIQNALFVNLQVPQTLEEKRLKRKVDTLNMIYNPIHSKICNREKVSDLEWMKFQLFISANGKFFRE